MIVTAANIEVVHDPSLDSNYILDPLQRSINAVKLLCGDNEIINDVTLQVFLPSHQVCQWNGEWAWNPNKKRAQGK